MEEMFRARYGERVEEFPCPLPSTALSQNLPVFTSMETILKSAEVAYFQLTMEKHSYVSRSLDFSWETRHLEFFYIQTSQLMLFKLWNLRKTCLWCCFGLAASSLPLYVTHAWDPPPSTPQIHDFTFCILQKFVGWVMHASTSWEFCQLVLQSVKLSWTFLVWQVIYTQACNENEGRAKEAVALHHLTWFLHHSHWLLIHKRFLEICLMNAKDLMLTILKLSLRYFRL